MTTPTVYTDDPDASWTFTVTDRDGADLDFTPLVAWRAGEYVLAGEWLGTVGATRKLQVPLDTLPEGSHALYLQVPGGVDFRLGVVFVQARS